MRGEIRFASKRGGGEGGRRMFCTRSRDVEYRGKWGRARALKGGKGLANGERRSGDLRGGGTGRILWWSREFCLGKKSLMSARKGAEPRAGRRLKMSFTRSGEGSRCGGGKSRRKILGKLTLACFWVMGGVGWE